MKQLTRSLSSLITQVANGFTANTTYTHTRSRARCNRRSVGHYNHHQVCDPVGKYNISIFGLNLTREIYLTLAAVSEHGDSDARRQLQVHTRLGFTICSHLVVTGGADRSGGWIGGAIGGSSVSGEVCLPCGTNVTILAVVLVCVPRSRWYH